MPRPLIRTGERQEAPLRAKPRNTTAALAGALHLGRRSCRYFELIRGLDPHGDTRVDAAEAIEALRAEFPVAAELPQALLARCYLGPPYEVHTLDLVGQIVEHYLVSQPLPPHCAPARRLALHEAYEVIEIYANHLVCVRVDGTVTEVPK